MKYLLLISILSTLTFTACEVKVEAINYNSEECANCKMKISDSRFGAELVSEKGKIFKYDSAECLVRTYLKKESPAYSYVMVTDYENPGTLIDAKQATFLISENQPSPMGGNLSAYANKNKAASILAEKGGVLLNFQELLDKHQTIGQ